MAAKNGCYISLCIQRSFYRIVINMSRLCRGDRREIEYIHTAGGVDPQVGQSKVNLSHQAYW